ncbi:MAG: L-seryl-tRNA(Sec) selenium transferase [Candidatus Methylomirabilis oxygeniifera]|uniref:L-seryl-tRNA(Sec) selenium transferase n=1 Tax=Methylomirabilis oxygeniifera TaxID=671143 RepID=D5MEN6_METO1|nr:MAG: L-seryl-tRNA(Sec) selenium transferase [Candidatus Methylomirabilis oxyfera]CBE68215.1 L-seryl-tRNA(Sec) selenium transferase (Selenocysteine synthase) (Sec synthase) (Selenocysteinyl-tRNA(Sec) synthase) [Candidatus Methylomirabilis oxyfera]
MDSETRLLLRQLPSVDELLQEPSIRETARTLPRWAVVEAIREVLERRRRLIANGHSESMQADLSSRVALVAEAQQIALRLNRPALRRLINATGVVIHTNLGRAPLAEVAVERMVEVARGYSNLEYDLERGDRGSRQDHAEWLLCRLTGAEAAFAVNNNAAAVLLAINTLAEGREVIVSRGELVEIGDSFRIPDIMRRAGGILREVGTTNRTYLKDYEDAVSPASAIILKVHTSNFRIQGFANQVPVAELAGLGEKTGLPVVEDVGSGALIDLVQLGLSREPMPSESIRAGADLVTFSGDKLLGGPQAGLIVGKRLLVTKLRRNPLARAVRIDKLSLAALEATLRLYLDEGQAVAHTPVLQALVMPLQEIERRARRLRDRITALASDHLEVSIIEGTSEVGGGALPLEAIPTRLVAVQGIRMTAQVLEGRLRRAEPPVMVRIKDNRIVVDPRTVSEDELDTLAELIASASVSHEADS